MQDDVRFVHRRDSNCDIYPGHALADELAAGMQLVPLGKTQSVILEVRLSANGNTQVIATVSSSSWVLWFVLALRRAQHPRESEFPRYVA